MDENRIQQRLNSETSKNSTNTDTYLKVNLESKERLLPPDEIDYVVNVGDRFNTERQASPFYRIVGTINPVVSNVLFNLNDTPNADQFTWAGFNYKDPSTLNYRFLDTSFPKDHDVSDPTDLTYSQAINTYLKELEGWFGYFDPDITKAALCNYLDMEPKRERFSFLTDGYPFNSGGAFQPTKNWELTITYPKSIDSGHTMVNGGLMIIDYVPVVVSTRQMVAFGTPVLHNLSVGSTVRISGTTGYDGDYVVVRLGLDDGSLMGYYFVINATPTTGSLPIGAFSKMKRIFAGQESVYYFRIFTKIQTRDFPIIQENNYESYKLAFSENVYTDTITQYVFNEDINVSGLTDNLGRPLSEIYLTLLKTDSNNLFTTVSSGLEVPFMPILNTSNVNTYLQTIPVINKIHNGGASPFPSHIPLDTNVSIFNNDFYGDVVDYNSLEVTETVLGEVAHRFNTLNRQTAPTINYVATVVSATTITTTLGPRQEGYYYKPHNLFKIREFSNYVEQGDATTEGIPSYAVNLGDGRYLWRDLLDIGFNESDLVTLDYPFLNGCHYLYMNTCFHVRRQDPFDNWGLYYSKFPADPIGERITDQFNVNRADNVC